MTRDELEHAIRAAAYVARDHEVVVIGSQAILGQFPDAPEVLRYSVEVDLYPKNHPERADLVDGALGMDSTFQHTHGFYVHGIGPETAVLPDGWGWRLVPVRHPVATGNATGWCLEVHDIAASKLAVGREKDLDYVAALYAYGLADPDEVVRRTASLELSDWFSEARRDVAVQRATRLAREARQQDVGASQAPSTPNSAEPPGVLLPDPAHVRRVLAAPPTAPPAPPLTSAKPQQPSRAPRADGGRGPEP